MIRISACLMANVSLIRSGGGEDGWTEWLNRIYRRAGLDGLLGGGRRICRLACAEGDRGLRSRRPGEGCGPRVSRSS